MRGDRVVLPLRVPGRAERVFGVGTFNSALALAILAVRLGCGMHERRLVHVLADSGMAQARGGRSLLATIVGYVLVAVIAYIVVRMMVGTIFWLTRTIIVVVIVGGLLTLYLNLKLPKE